MNMKQLGVLTLTLAAFAAAPAEAAAPEDTTGIDAPGEWHIRMIPEERLSPEEQEEARWTPLLQNDIGTYDYEESSITHAVPGSDLISINLRISALNPQLREKLKERYAATASDLPAFHLEETLAFHQEAGTYAIVHTKIFGEKNNLLDEKDVPSANANFQPIPPGSVVEAAYEKAAGLTISQNTEANAETPDKEEE